MAQSSATNTLRLLRLDDVRSLTGVSTTTLYRMIDAGAFPKQVSLGPRSVAWIESEIIGWIEDRVADRARSAAGVAQ